MAATTTPVVPDAASRPASPGGEGRGGEQVLLPVGAVARLLVVELCRPGPLDPVDKRDGWVLYRIAGEGGAVLEAALRTLSRADYHSDPQVRDPLVDDLMAAEFLDRARSDPKAQAECQAMLAYLAERDGLLDQFRWGELAREVYGPYAKTQHTDLMRLCAAFLCRAQIRFHVPGANGSAAATATAAPPRGSASPWGGVPMVGFERHGRCQVENPRRCRHPLTTRLHPSFAAALRARRPVPMEHLRLPQDGHTNPEGRGASRATLLRARTTAFFDWHAAEPDPSASGAKVLVTTFQELLRRAGLDVNAFIRRRHLGELLDDIVSNLKLTKARVGIGVRSAPERARRLLSTVLYLEGPPATAHPTSPDTSDPERHPRPPGAGLAPANGAPPRRPPSRSPP